MKNTKKYISILVSLSITVVLFLYLFNASDIEKIKQTMLGVKPWHLLLYALFSLSNVFFRSFRYKLLLEPVKIPWVTIFGVTLVRNLFVDMFPAKLGAFSYIALLKERYKVAMNACLVSFFYSFLFDIVTLPPFLMFSMMTVTFDQQMPSPVFMVGGAMIIILFSLLIIIFLDKIIKMGNHLLLWAGNKFTLKNKRHFIVLAGKADELQNAVMNLRKSGIMIKVFFISLLVRFFKYLGLYCLFASVYAGARGLFNLEHFGQLIFGITAADITPLLPFQAFGGYGTWETAWSIVLMLFGYPKSDAAVVGLTIHAYSQIWEYFIGFIAFCVIIVPFVIKKRKK
ncbi:MAG: hypothetical protein A2Y62_21255 [Candidatus Fischerbacteria bacterium RBG_13_37_8]|uniref:Flippase-like domain-containing protein n=1 Tax=Candidatus Fischerbacteria bacterium RBG_13_37_8 TaxID=1817863 RepID=A0A1F5VP91_9BACT|nr:MAG: hypothetical protein A2Y62_21255 [Candidatus Fischerbacteria bacterium RBG_13_37_8]